MPKIKTNKIAAKKFRVTGKGKVKRAQAGMRHNTAKKSPKSRRKLRQIKYVDATNMRNLKGQLPNTL